MQDIRCDHDGCNRFLARVNGDKLELWCPKCKTFHPVAIVGLVGQMVVELQNGHEPETGKWLLG